MSHFTVETLRSAVGHHAFYSIVMELDPENAAGWFQMVTVQNTFHDGEGDYKDEGRTYSESMRHTLHWAIVFIFEDPELLAEAQASSGGLLGYFVRLHPAAFKANGACSLNWSDSKAIVDNTHDSMITFETAGRLTSGAWWQEEYAVARRAAEHVRTLRKEAGLPVTPDGYHRPRMSGADRRRARHGAARYERYMAQQAARQ